MLDFCRNHDDAAIPQRTLLAVQPCDAAARLDAYELVVVVMWLLPDVIPGALVRPDDGDANQCSMRSCWVGQIWFTRRRVDPDTPHASE